MLFLKDMRQHRVLCQKTKKTNNMQKILNNEKKYFLTLRLLNKKISIWKENKKIKLNFWQKNLDLYQQKLFRKSCDIIKIIKFK